MRTTCLALPAIKTSMRVGGLSFVPLDYVCVDFEGSVLFPAVPSSAHRLRRGVFALLLFLSIHLQSLHFRIGGELSKR